MFLWLGDGSVGNALVQPWKPEDGFLEVTGKVECGSPRLETQCDGSGSRWISGVYCAANLDCLAKYWPMRETVPQTKSGRCLKNGIEGVLSLCAHIRMQACICTCIYLLNRDASWGSDSLQEGTSNRTQLSTIFLSWWFAFYVFSGSENAISICDLQSS